ncbi:MAG: 5'-nucleotidase C-terminal domain-containing protein [Deinococcaceae bacterium]
MDRISRRSLIKMLGLGGMVGLSQKGESRAQAGLFHFTLLHTNDTHDHLEPTTLSGKTLTGQDYKVQYGGVARIKTVIDTLKKRAVNPVILDAGDVFTGTLYGMIYKGLADLAYMEAFGVQVQTLGNHEFDYGPGQLAEYLKNATFPIVSANVDVSDEPALRGLIRPHTVLEVGGHSLGVVGVTTPDTPITSTPGDRVKFLDPLSSVQKSVDSLRDQGIKNIVLLSHLGYSQDVKLAAQLRGVAVIVGGHSHTPLGTYQGEGLPSAEGRYPTVVSNPVGNPVLVTQVWEWGKMYGQLRVSLDEEGVPRAWRGKVYPVTDTYKGDSRLAATLRAFMIPLESFRKNTVGQAKVRLNGDRTDVRKRETNLSNLIADANLWKTQTYGTQISLQNGGGVRASIEAGPITQGQIIDVQPFGNTLYVMDLSGSEIWEALENGVSQWESGAGRFLHVAGMRYTADLAKPVGQRVIRVEVGTDEKGFSAIDRSVIYKVVTNNFVASGGDGFSVLKSAKGTRVDTYLPDYSVMTDYIASIKEVNPKVEGRIVLLNEK